MKEYYALINDKGQIAAVASAKESSYTNMGAKMTFDSIIDAREYFKGQVKRGQAVHITRREAEIYARLLREKEGLGKRLEKIDLELGVR